MRTVKEDKKQNLSTLVEMTNLCFSKII